MKKLLVILPVFTLACLGCQNVEHGKAKALVVSLIQKEDSEKYSEAYNYYSEEFNLAESLEARTAKYKKLREVMGTVQSIECISAKDSTDSDDRPIVQLIYKIKHRKVTSLEAFTVVSQNGDYKVEQDDIKQENL